MKKIVTVVLVGMFLFSCGSKKQVVLKKQDNRTKTNQVVKGNSEETPKKSTKTYANATEEYIDTFKDIAQDEMRLYNIPASITLAQGILESASGLGRLSVEANNHFGIKCHEWTGDKIFHDDDEKGECFRKYRDAKYSFRDHSLFLTKRPRYGKLFTLKKGDYKGWAKELREAGYATDKKYPQKLISLIERYNLNAFDKEVLGDDTYAMEVGNDVATNDENFDGYGEAKHVVTKGDTLYSISKRYNLSVKELQQLNNLGDINIGIGQVLRIR